MIKLIYFSPTGTTKRVVETIGKYMGQTESIDLTLNNNRNKTINCKPDDVLILALPVYGGRIPLMVEAAINNIKGHQTPCILVAVYGNRHYDDALLEMNDIVSSNGFYPVAAGAFIGEHSYTSELAGGRPDESDKNRCKYFAKQINLEAEGLFIIPGNRPYRERKESLPLGPTLNEKCTTCGLCVTQCPTNALTLTGFVKYVKVDELKCIRCHACVKNCPSKAIEFDSRIDPVRAWLIDNFTTRREPELFYRQFGGNNESRS